MFEFFGWFVLILCTGLVVVPYLRGRSELITSWNLLLLGLALYIGLGALEVEYEELHWEQLSWFSPSRALKERYILGSAVFLGSLFFFYYFLKSPQSFARRRLAKCPPFHKKFVYSFLVASGLVMSLVLVGPHIPVISAILGNVSHKLCVFATVFAFVHWWRTKSPFALVVFLAMLACGAMFAMVVFSGRRLLLSVIVVPVFCYYWQVLRYKSPVANMTKVAVLACAVLLVSTAYSTFRFFNLKKSNEGTERTVATVIEQMGQANWESVVRPLRKDFLHYGAQYTGYYSLLVMRYIDDNQLKSEPVQSLKWLASYPMPRVFWEGKPQIIGIRMIDIAQIPYKTNWGVGIVGHGFLEGGYPVLVLYAFLAVLTVRWLDAPLMRDPQNPFLMAVLCTAAPHVVAWPRGDIAIMWIEIIETILFAMALGLVGRIVFGRDRSQSQNVAHGVALPTARPVAQIR